MIELASQNPYGLSLQSPLIAAAGALNFGGEVARQLGFHTPNANHGLGALVTRTVTFEPRHGRPRLTETPAGLLYSGYEQNPGLRAVLQRYPALWLKWNLPVILSLGGPDLLACVEAIEGYDGISAIEIHLASCGLSEPNATEQLLRQVRAASLLPLIVKLPADGPSVALAQAAQVAGADAVALLDGLPASAPDGTEGYLGGPAIRPLALARVREVCTAVDLPVIGIGGITRPADVAAMLAAGASAVGLASALIGNLERASELAAAL